MIYNGAWSSVDKGIVDHSPAKEEHEKVAKGRKELPKFEPLLARLCAQERKV